MYKRQPDDKGGASRLVAVKAVSPSYPLRGNLQLREAPDSAVQLVAAAPQPGSVWVDAALLDALQLQVGDPLLLGEARLTIDVYKRQIHHIASSIQASSIIAGVAEETMSAVDRLFPERLGQEPAGGASDQVPPLESPQRWQAVPAEGNGYIESVDNALLLRLAREHDTICLLYTSRCV